MSPEIKPSDAALEIFGKLRKKEKEQTQKHRESG